MAVSKDKGLRRDSVVIEYSDVGFNNFVCMGKETLEALYQQCFAK